MAGPGDLFQAALEYLDACEQALHRAPGGPIERCYVSPGQPAWDVPNQLTVHIGGPSEGDVSPASPGLAYSHRVAVSGSVLMVQMTATVLRPVVVVGNGPRQTVPGADVLQQAAERSLGDLWAIYNFVRDRKRRGLLFAAHDGSATTRETSFDPAVSLATSGGVCGWQIPIRVQVDGYAEVTDG